MFWSRSRQVARHLGAFGGRFFSVSRLFAFACSALAAPLSGLATPPTQFIAVGSPPGAGPTVTILHAETGEVMSTFLVGEETFLGGVNVAAGDVNGDDWAEAITAPMYAPRPSVRISYALSGYVLREFQPFAGDFSGGLSVAAGDLDGDGRAEIVVGISSGGPKPKDGGGPRVLVFSGSTGAQTGSLLAYESSFTGGVRIATGDVDGDGRADIIVGAGPGRAPAVRVFKGTDLSLLHDIMALDPAYREGVVVAAGDLSGDGAAEIIVGPGGAGTPRVAAFDGPTGAKITDFL
jgi:serralysin